MAFAMVIVLTLLELEGQTPSSLKDMPWCQFFDVQATKRMPGVEEACRWQESREFETKRKSRQLLVLMQRLGVLPNT